MCDFESCNKPKKKNTHHRRPLPERGWIQFLLLGLINEEPMHGYQLIDKMENRGYVRSGRMRSGSIYTILNRMEKRGMLSSDQQRSNFGRTRRTYKITVFGRDALKRGLEHMLRRKKVLDELAEYYEKHFRNLAPDE